ncbi:glutaredoxin domain-containing protein [Diplodia corticola]|uniref:Glutaredoxin-like protein n=1 Tax=Diplodia corticola TaxID=236234 RepID=A0A1J9RB02_9PEZI|nr:glutaredoxin domain-containing protein [Diplodia corticola]OJD38782.1 glutaredoxin domain-containing protein [Diplodia corticola]
MFAPTARLLQRACRLTLFTRQGCALCDNAKGVLSNVWDKRPFEYTEIDVMAPGQQKWKDVYEFDTPVIHVEKMPANDGQETTTAAPKLMHRFKEEQVEALMEEAEKDTTE